MVTIIYLPSDGNDKEDQIKEEDFLNNFEIKFQPKLSVNSLFIYKKFINMTPEDSFEPGIVKREDQESGVFDQLKRYVEIMKG